MTNFYYQPYTSNFFNKKWYKNTYNLNLKDDELLTHYSNIGHKKNFNPSLFFDTKWYKEQYKLNPNENPIEHFCKNVNNKNIKPNSKCKFYINSFVNVNWTTFPKFEFIPFKNENKRINLLLPGVGNSAGPNTLYLFSNFLAQKNYNVRIIFLYSDVDNDFIKNIIKKFNLSKKIQFETLHIDDISISYDDIFITSAWWTVYPLKFILGYLNNKKFIWFIQENELLLHSGNDVYSKAISCYNMDYYSLVNTKILFNELKKVLFPFTQKIYNESECLCFEPAFDTNKLYYIEKKNREKKIIIFYSRDETIAERNCIKLVKSLLINSCINNLINKDDIIIGFGGTIGTYNLISNYYYTDIGFLNLDEYYKLLRKSDILISFQIAPHPSYPPLEMAFCNGVTIHIAFGNKNKDTIKEYTDKIIMCEPDINSLLEGMEIAINKINNNDVNKNSPKLLHNNWDIPFEQCYHFIQKNLIF